MKLYTKEMFLIAAKKCEVSMIDSEHIMKYIDEYVTPIELPTDEEIKEEVSKLKFSKEGYKGGVIEGMIWMRDKIQGGNNEQ